MAGKKILMNEKHIIRLAMEISGETPKTVSPKIGITSNSFNNQLGRPDSTMTLTSVFAALRAMGFEIVVRDENGKYGNVEYVIAEVDETDPEWKKRAAQEQADAKKRRIDYESEIVASIRTGMKPPSTK